MSKVIACLVVLATKGQMGQHKQYQARKKVEILAIVSRLTGGVKDVNKLIFDFLPSSVTDIECTYNQNLLYKEGLIIKSFIMYTWKKLVNINSNNSTNSGTTTTGISIILGRRHRYRNRGDGPPTLLSSLMPIDEELQQWGITHATKSLIIKGTGAIGLQHIKEEIDRIISQYE